MQRANVIAFVVLSSLLIGGWFLWTNYGDKPEVVEVDPKEKEAKEKAAKLKEEKDKAAKKAADELAAAKKKKADEEEAKAIAAKKLLLKDEPSRTETLGGPGFHLTVDTTSRGAGVRRVVLNRFRMADWRGRPTLDADDNPVDLELIQDDGYAPSFRMYHYLEPKDEHPVLGFVDKDGKFELGLGEKNWKFEERSPAGAKVHEVRYSTTVPGLDQVKIVKTYRLEPTAYHVTMLLEIHDLRTDREAPKIPFRYQLTGGQGLPVEGEWYTATFRNAFIGLADPGNRLYRATEDSMRISARQGGDTFPGEKYRRGDNRLVYAGTANQFFGVMIVVDDEQPNRDDGGAKPENILAWARPTLETQEKRGTIVKIDGDEMLFRDKESVLASYVLLPRTKKHLENLDLKAGDPAVLSSYETPDGRRIASWVRLGETLKPQFDDITMRVNSEVIELHARDVHKHQFLLYHGPVKAALLTQFSGDKEVPAELVDRYTNTLHLKTLTDYHFDNWFSRYISSPFGLTWLIIQFTRLMHWLLNLLQYVFGYGVSIIVLTIIVRGAMFPISRKQAIFSIKMQELAPELKKITEKYPDDPAARMQATQEFYRKHGINPLGSCWPVFLQMPIFLGLYFALQESIHFRLAEFWPLWIPNLAAPDMLFYWSESIPIISSPDSASGILGALYLGPYLNILPMVAVVFMMIQQMQTMPPPTDDQQAMQQKMLKFMTIFFGIMFYKVAAGLCIYFIASSLWGLAERKLLPKKKPVVEYPGAGAAGAAVGSPVPAATVPLTPKGKSKWDKKEKAKEKDNKEPVTTFDKLKALWREILKKAEKK